jgi:hypothetical protein
MDVLFGLFIFVAVFAISLVLFSGWLIIAIGKGIMRLFGMSCRPGPKQKVRTVKCPRSRCGEINPEHARFCRRCGQPMPQRFEYMKLGRAACW